MITFIRFPMVPLPRHGVVLIFLVLIHFIITTISTNKFRNQSSVNNLMIDELNLRGRILVSTTTKIHLIDHKIIYIALIPKHRIFFCRINKVGSTGISMVFSQLGRNDLEEYRKRMSMKNLVLWTVHNPPMYNYTLTDVENIVSDPTWYKAVFYREPLSRFLSAFRSKCEHFDPKGSLLCELIFGKQDASFPEAVALLATSGDLRNAHFAKQMTFCGGLDKYLRMMNRTMQFNPLTTHDDMRLILREANVPIDAQVNQTLNKVFPRITDANRFKVRHSDVERNGANHTTNSGSTKTLLRYYSVNDCLVRVVVDYFQPDYDLFKIPYPKWALAPLSRTNSVACLEEMKRILGRTT